jgi:hypothetical protein
VTLIQKPNSSPAVSFLPKAGNFVSFVLLWLIFFTSLKGRTESALEIPEEVAAP